jgi:hypothetical protein
MRRRRKEERKERKGKKGKERGAREIERDREILIRVYRIFTSHM